VYFALNSLRYFVIIILIFSLPNINCTFPDGTKHVMDRLLFPYIKLRRLTKLVHFVIVSFSTMKF
jgi:multimeric flavodoxin WrbA